MAELLNSLGQQQMSILKNPFLVDKVTTIFIHMQQAKYSDTGWAVSGSITFKNGDTEGVQKFAASTWDEVALQIKNFIGTLK